MLWIEEKYVALVSSQLQQFAKKDARLWNFRCPYCGDSHKSKVKARGYIFDSGKDHLLYKCHNCNISTTFSKLLQFVDESLYKEMVMEDFAESSGSTKASLWQREPEPEVHKNDEWKTFQSLTVPILSLPRNHPAVQYLDSRQIPRRRYESIYYIEDTAKLAQIMPEKYEERLAYEHDSRIVFPILTRRNELVGVVARAIYEYAEKRYINLKFYADKNLTWNLESVDLSKTIYVFEGIMDSLFFENSVAVNTSDFMKIDGVLPKHKVVMIFDNQPRNRELLKQIVKASEHGYSVALWHMDESLKDVNDMIKAGYTPEELLDHIETNKASGLALKLKIEEWRKVYEG